MTSKLQVKDQIDFNSDTKTHKSKPLKDNLGRSYGTGKRKDSVARVWIKAGTGAVKINGKDLKDYFRRDSLVTLCLRPFEITKTGGQFDVFATASGGGLSGQAGALKHGISRALDKFDPELHLQLSTNGLLTRDSRVVERKKPGMTGARTPQQFSKR